MSKVISIERYVASNNQDGAMNLLKKWGAPKPKNAEELVKYLEKATVKFGHTALAEMAKLQTPYHDLLFSLEDEGKSNCSGCGGTCGGKKSDFVDGTAESLQNLRKEPLVVATPAPKQEEKAPTPTPAPVIEKYNFFKEHQIATSIVGTIAGIWLIRGIATGKLFS